MQNDNSFPSPFNPIDAEVRGNGGAPQRRTGTREAESNLWDWIWGRPRSHAAPEGGSSNKAAGPAGGPLGRG